jgi:hypothetical protein
VKVLIVLKPVLFIFSLLSWFSRRCKTSFGSSSRSRSARNASRASYWPLTTSLCNLFLV